MSCRVLPSVDFFLAPVDLHTGKATQQGSPDSQVVQKQLGPGICELHDGLAHSHASPSYRAGG